jgi:hypothetical protein
MSAAPAWRSGTAWPISTEATFGGTPAASIHDAAEWRSSCRPNGSSFAASQPRRRAPAAGPARAGRTSSRAAAGRRDRPGVGRGVPSGFPSPISTRRSIVASGASSGTTAARRRTCAPRVGAELTPAPRGRRRATAARAPRRGGRSRRRRARTAARPRAPARRAAAHLARRRDAVARRRVHRRQPDSAAGSWATSSRSCAHRYSDRTAFTTVRTREPDRPSLDELVAQLLAVAPAHVREPLLRPSSGTTRPSSAPFRSSTARGL